MTRRETERYCAQHILVDGAKENEPRSERIYCPLDSTHSVWKKDLQRHLKKCQSKKSSQLPTDSWFLQNVNDSRQDGIQSSSNPILHSEYIEWIGFVQEEYNRIVTEQSLLPANESVLVKTDMPLLQHSGLDRRLSELSNQKHAIQQASLIAHLERYNLVRPENHFVEFGAGRGELSRYLHQVLIIANHQRLSVNPSFLLVDRAGTRMKLDSKIAKDAAELDSSCRHPNVRRFKVDIKDLALYKDACFEMNPENTGSGLVAISKHLCGAATDLTIQCLANYSSSDRNVIPVSGILIALCCRHRCTFSTFPRSYVESLRPITSRGFEILTKMTSWAVCGRRQDSRPDQCDHVHERDAPLNPTTEQDKYLHPSKLPIEEREIIGIKARQIIDYARARHLQSLGFKVELVRYVDQSVSSENICLIAVP
ncbi:methyltransferase TRM13-domain-containing protein [Lipomyces oligophaga]|uniref:methyltransferase TRM13-domain-containing protein n=1 Tax=Lipomyces oligophaga TaxID=45792 RepID=UPI0034CECE85